MNARMGVVKLTLEAPLIEGEESIGLLVSNILDVVHQHLRVKVTRVNTGEYVTFKIAGRDE